MLAIGIIILLIGSITRGWVVLNYRRGPVDAPIIFTPVFSASVSIAAILLALIASIMIDFGTAFWVGLITFGAFWFFSWIWCPVLSAIGL